ncbi:hypothetical protein [Paenibacillus sp. YN15]|uniref:hypothetical protein n=1 Tax=Paenibacillus sp. YN15 TaxID=1742774 RepID=UPI000DCC5372|nr:hypothetical protein [Paenibacillus sp. YN15]RAU97947.1 hypothetical protein DQG13_18380 [Paenibacillus sp. YN15]
MKTVIELLHDPELDTRPVDDLLFDMEQQSKKDPGVRQLYKLIVRGLEVLEHHGLDFALREYLVETREDGKPYTIKLAKELRDHVPLIEFRVNWVGTGAFRAVFFEYVRDNTQILIFPRAIVKQATYDPEFERIVAETESIYQDFCEFPEKYIVFPGGVEDVETK